MSKKLINHDAAYTLGEEAFRAGFEAAWNVMLNWKGQSRDKAMERAWFNYVPSEDVKALIGKPMADSDFDGIMQGVKEATEHAGKIGHHVVERPNGQFDVYYGESFASGPYYSRLDAESVAMTLDTTAR